MPMNQKEWDNFYAQLRERDRWRDPRKPTDGSSFGRTLRLPDPGRAPTPKPKGWPRKSTLPLDGVLRW
jgi:hypothetical protein